MRSFRLMALLAMCLMLLAAPVQAKTTITFWHGMGGELGEITDEMIKEFNASQDKYEVKGVYKGNYDEAMTAAIAAGNFDKAAEVLGELLHMQEAPIKLLAVLGTQLRKLYTARLAIEHRKGVPYLMELWGRRAAYPAERRMQSARRFSLPWCRRAVLRCGQTDLAMKSTGADGEELLIGLLMELAVKKGA